ncbi:MAG: MGMT family protein [Candidatus Moraniibacteriota bacterium]
MKKSFWDSVLSVVRGIPKGGVLSYGEVASRAGYPGSARAVGSLMKNNADPMVPCHRVIRIDGRVGEYNGLAGKKIDVLRKEGVRIVNGKVVSEQS